MSTSIKLISQCFSFHADDMVKLAIFIAISLVALPSTRSKCSKGCPERSVNQEEHAGCTKVMSWVCTCGSTRRELISPKYADLFRQLISQYSTTHYNNNPIQLNSLSVPKAPSQSSSGDSTSSSDAQSVGSVDSTDGSSVQASVSTGPSSTGSTTITLDFNTQAFVHLLVRKADRYILSSIKVTDKDSRGFFRDIIVRYHRHRGFIRRIFSIFVYSHCDFVKVSTMNMGFARLGTSVLIASRLNTIVHIASLQFQDSHSRSRAKTPSITSTHTVPSP